MMMLRRLALSNVLCTGGPCTALDLEADRQSWVPVAQFQSTVGLPLLLVCVIGPKNWTTC